MTKCVVYNGELKMWETVVNLRHFNKKIASCCVEFKTTEELEAFKRGMKKGVSLILPIEGKFWSEEDLYIDHGPESPVE
jgi:hypothetical protein